MVASRGRTARLTTVYPNAGETKRRLLQTCNESVMERFGLSRISNVAAQNWEERPISRAVSGRSDLWPNLLVTLSESYACSRITKGVRKVEDFRSDSERRFVARRHDVNSFALSSIPNRQSTSRFFANLCDGLFPVSFFDCERQS